MVRINSDHSNIVAPLGTYGGSRCMCRQCERNRNGRNLMCCESWDYGKPDGECPICGTPTVDGEAATGCVYSPVECELCGARPCDGSC